jgi:hypothetical protein
VLSSPSLLFSRVLVCVAHLCVVLRRVLSCAVVCCRVLVLGCLARDCRRDVSSAGCSTCDSRSDGARWLRYVSTAAAAGATVTSGASVSRRSLSHRRGGCCCCLQLRSQNYIKWCRHRLAEWHAAVRVHRAHRATLCDAAGVLHTVRATFRRGAPHYPGGVTHAALLRFDAAVRIQRHARRLWARAFVARVRNAVRLVQVRGSRLACAVMSPSPSSSVVAAC